MHLLVPNRTQLTDPVNCGTRSDADGSGNGTHGVTRGAVSTDEPGWSTRTNRSTGAPGMTDLHTIAASRGIPHLE
jgi:hypothetical protein